MSDEPCDVCSAMIVAPARVCARCSELVAALAATGDATIWESSWVDSVELTRHREDVHATLAEHDLESYAHLAVAYAEMGLSLDAVASASVALRDAPGSVAHREALGVLFSDRLLRPNGLERLRSMVRRAGDG